MNSLDLSPRSHTDAEYEGVRARSPSWPTVAQVAVGLEVCLERRSLAAAWVAQGWRLLTCKAVE